MKILMINVVCGVKSTGRICTDLAMQLEKQGHEVKIAYGRDNIPSQYQRFAVRIGSNMDVKMHGLKARLFDGMGLGSKAATEKFIEWVREYDPDVIHLHNIHGYYINVPVLFDYLKSSGKKVIWTLHDCWSFTGHCTYFNYENCNRWQTGCGGCPQKGVYPVLWGSDRSAENFKLKRSLFSGLSDLTIVTPSVWLENLVKASYMGHYPIQTIHNGIDTSVFKPIKSDVHERLGLVGKKIILGVAAVWDRRKGLDDFIQLSKHIDDSYAIVLVGLKEKQIEKLPEKIIGIRRTDSVAELVELYSAAYVFVNPTYEDNYPTTNLEAIACGTPVITYNTGGSPESANEYGITLKDKNANSIYDALPSVANIANTGANFSNEKTIQEYLTLYKEML